MTKENLGVLKIYTLNFKINLHLPQISRAHLNLDLAHSVALLTARLLRTLLALMESF